MNDITIESNLKAVLGPGLSKPKDPDQVSTSGKSFSETLADSLGQVNALQNDADKAIEEFVSGKSQNRIVVHFESFRFSIINSCVNKYLQFRNKSVNIFIAAW